MLVSPAVLALRAGTLAGAVAGGVLAQRDELDAGIVQSTAGESARDLKAQAMSYAHPAFWVPFSLVGEGGR